ncbi:iron chelate uptake ABC transporter family permease subunit [Glutamicibacter sp. JL.03c]|uniref:FecCD family ABC transporter permease n=1 Tax=Glutamicibacter sp. JL.03c TaxID=2984842 RepID=UPI0021F6DFF2|nr:iron chelate uptake ABC transporter family permease subunit [Glutamicibacter sp. JL.03c]UYQ78758.1 iron chelate uptake ABC transporter family permease subunit [Glutamicibacter sp. JL.03c]
MSINGVMDPPHPAEPEVAQPIVVPTGRREMKLQLGRWTWRVDRASAMVAALLAVAALLTGFISLALGDIRVPFDQLLPALLGNSERRYDVVVRDWRLTRVLLALVFGFALGISGALFQSLTRNPLGSPDVIGFSSGAYTVALALMLFTTASAEQIAMGSILGGLLAAAMVFIIANREGTSGFRLIVVGIGVGAMLASANTFMLLAAQRQVAMSAAVWGSGSLNSVSNTVLGPSMVGIALFSAMAILLQRQARILECGDALATSLGVNTSLLRVAMVIAGVGLVAVTTAAAGPIAFVALVAPQISARLTRRAELDLVPAGCLGALLLVLADTVARVAFMPVQLPVGIVTVCLGGMYLIWLLIRESRS